jgi:hypothetical protein
MIGLVTAAVQLQNLLWLCIPGGSLIVGILAICNRVPRIPRRSECVVFAAGWICLVIAGTLCRDVLMIVITFPLIFVSFGIAALLWRSSGFAWGNVSTLCYWVGALSVIVGAVRFGIMAALIQCIDTHCHPLEYLPPRPHVALELILWSMSAIIVCLGLILSRQFGRISIAIPVTLLLLLNPTILLMVAWLQPTMGM